jgi:hypothetical protein
MASLSKIFPIGAALGKYKYLGLSDKVLFFYLLISLLIFEPVAWYTAINRIQNHFVKNTFIPLEFLCLSYICWLSLETVKFKKVLIVLVCLIFLFQISSNLFYWESFNRFNSIANALPNLGLMFFVILYFYELLRDQHADKLSTFPMFWISSGILLYVSINFFLFIFGEFVMFNPSKDISKLSAIIQSVSNIIYHIFLAIGLWFSKTPPQLSPSSK